MLLEEMAKQMADNVNGTLAPFQLIIQTSTAMSLKRIADALEKANEVVNVEERSFGAAQTDAINNGPGCAMDHKIGQEDKPHHCGDCGRVVICVAGRP